MTVYAYIATGLFLLTLVIVGFSRLYETPGDYMLTPIPNPEGVEKYTCRTPAGDATVTMVQHPDFGPSFKIETHFAGAGDEVAYVAPSRQVVERTLRGMAEDHLARRALPQEPA